MFLGNFTLKLIFWPYQISSDEPIDKRRYKIHLDFVAVKNFNIFIWIKAGSNDGLYPRRLACKQTFYSFRCVDLVLMIDKSTKFLKKFN